MAAAQSKQTRELRSANANRVRVQNGPVRKRRTPQSGNRAVHTLRAVTRRPRARREAAEPMMPLGLPAFGMLVGAGAFIACILVIALQWQRSAHQLNREEVELRSALDVTNDQRQRLLIEQQRAASPRENDLRSRQNGLTPYQFDERQSFTPPSPKSKAATPPLATLTRQTTTQQTATRQALTPPVQLAPQPVAKSSTPKTAPVAAAPVTATKAAAVTKANASKTGAVHVPMLPNKAPAVHGLAAKRTN